MFFNTQRTKYKGERGVFSPHLHSSFDFVYQIRLLMIHISQFPKTLVNEEELREILQVDDDYLLTHFCKSELNSHSEPFGNTTHCFHLALGQNSVYVKGL